MKRNILGSMGLSGLLLLAGCGGGEKAAGPETKAPQQLNIYIWTNYLPQDVLADFEKRTGIKTRVDTYDSNETILSKLQSGVADYDIIVPSDYMLKVLISEKLVRELDRSRLQGFDNLDPRFLNQKFDPENHHSVPYVWGTAGIGYDTTKVPAPIDSWGALFDPRYKGRILMLDDAREAFGAVLKLQGRSLNETDPAVLKQVAETLKKQKPLVLVGNRSEAFGGAHVTAEG